MPGLGITDSAVQPGSSIESLKAQNKLAVTPSSSLEKEKHLYEAAAPQHPLKGWPVAVDSDLAWDGKDLVL
jgi:hypothetical protein